MTLDFGLKVVHIFWKLGSFSGKEVSSSWGWERHAFKQEWGKTTKNEDVTLTKKPGQNCEAKNGRKDEMKKLQNKWKMKHRNEGK